MANGQIKHVFPGGNTPSGFFSYYDYIIPITAQRIFILKGGPGTGKSTFMKKISAEMVSRGYNSEHHHCSSDPNSLDGVVLPELDVAFIDGTAPHIVDPKNPGCVDEIIHLGEFWDEAKMVKNKAAIISCNRDISRQFQRAYRTLRAAKSLYDDWEVINSEALDYKEANTRANQLLEPIFAGITTTGYGKMRKLFASAITPDGAVNYLASIIDTMPRCFVVVGQPGTGKATLLQRIIDTAIVKGLSVEAYYCPLDPQKPEHILLPELGVAVTTATDPHRYIPSTAEAMIDMDDCLDTAIIAKYSSEIAYDQAGFWQNFQQAITYIKKAKQLHDDLETYYIPNMNFTAVQQLWEITLQRLLTYGK